MKRHQNRHTTRKVREREREFFLTVPRVISLISRSESPTLLYSKALFFSPSLAVMAVLEEVRRRRIWGAAFAERRAGWGAKKRWEWRRVAAVKEGAEAGIGLRAADVAIAKPFVFDLSKKVGLILYIALGVTTTAYYLFFSKIWTKYIGTISSPFILPLVYYTRHTTYKVVIHTHDKFLFVWFFDFWFFF